MYHSVSKLLSYFQKKKIAHRDLKPQNILFFDNKKTKFKVCDFWEVKENFNNAGITIRGTICYFAAEVNYSYLNQEDLQKNHNPFKSDVYSFALILIFSLIKELPFTKKKRTNKKNWWEINKSTKWRKWTIWWIDKCFYRKYF